jgi:hypothetical protein
MKPDLFQAPDYYNLDDLLNRRAQHLRSLLVLGEKKFLLIIEDYSKRRIS